MIGHITQHELRRHTTTIELANGYLNRILLIACRRQRLLPEGGHHDPLARHRPHPPARRRPSNTPRPPGEVRLDTRRPRALASRLPPARPNPTPGSSARSPPAPKRTRSASRSSTPSPTASTRSARQHLDAALALQDYAARSAAWALTGATGDPLAEQIHAALTANPAGLTRSQISDTLNHNQPAGQIDHALHALQTAGRATVTQIATGGRPAQLWTANPAR